MRYAAGDRAGCPDRGRRSIIRRNTPGPALSGAFAALWLLGSGCTALREIPRDKEVIELFKKLVGADPLPQR